MPWSTFSGVMRLSRPASSSGPNSPQLLPGGRFRQRGVVMGCVPPFLRIGGVLAHIPREETAMALMLGKLYDALRAGNVPEQQAREAAEEVAGYDREIASIRTDVRVVQAVSGIIVVILLAVLWQLFALRGGVSALHAQVDAGFATLNQR